MKRCIYHMGCRDGFCAAWVLSKFVSIDSFEPMAYGQRLAPGYSGDEIWILDYSFPRQSMMDLMATNTVHLFDHHETARAELEDLGPRIRFNLCRSACGMVADYFGFESWIVDYVEDRDLWRFELPNSRLVNAGLTLVPFNFGAWDGLDYQSVLSEGMVVVRAWNDMINFAVSRAHNGGTCSTVLVSEIGERLARASRVGIGAVYYYGNGGLKVSLRSLKGGADVSEIAKRYGGGGHPNAAGFTIPYQSIEHFLERELGIITGFSTL